MQAQLMKDQELTITGWNGRFDIAAKDGLLLAIPLIRRCGIMTGLNLKAHRTKTRR